MTDPLFALLLAAREGDDTAMRELVIQTQPVVERVCRGLESTTTTGCGDEVDDLVQETYLRAIRAMDRFRGDSPVLPWLITIARRTCADHVRRRQRHRRLLERIEQHAEDTVVNPPGALTTRMEASVLSELLDDLAPDRRDAFVLTQVTGLSYDETAALLGCPVGTVRSRVARARADLATLVASGSVPIGN